MTRQKTPRVRYTEMSALLSTCLTYRYELRRRWEPEGQVVLWLMINPSTADAAEDDQTIRKCVGFSRAWGYSGIVVANLFALRSPEVEDILTHRDPVGADNDARLHALSEHAGLTIAGWGSKPGELGRRVRDRAANVRANFARAGRQMHCLAMGVGKHGQPGHPLFLPYGLTPKLLS